MKRSWALIAVVACSFLLSGVSVAAAEEVESSGEGAAPATALDETCNPGLVCVWTNIYYSGVKGTSLCTGGAHTLAGWKFSAKNRCANKASWLRINGNAVECLDPGVSRGVAEFNELWIGAEGSRC
jgi:hypothetical protein